MKLKFNNKEYKVKSVKNEPSGSYHNQQLDENFQLWSSLEKGEDPYFYSDETGMMFVEP